jgi:hypothetical protein
MTKPTLRGLTPLLLTSLVYACGDAGTSGTDPGDGGTQGDATHLADGGAPSGDDSSAPPPGSDGGTTPDGSSGPDAGTDSGAGTAGKIKTIFIIVMENHNWSSIAGSNSAPYINGLLKTASYCDQYFDNPSAVHPSEPNYIWLEAADNLGVADDSDPSGSRKLTTPDHVVSQLTAKGVSWRSYQEDLPKGQCGTKSTGGYAAKHNPMVFFTDISGDPPSNTSATCLQNVKPYADLAGDLSANTVARYNFITPNLCNDMHDAFGCKNFDQVKNGDTWLAAEVPKILASQAYKDNGALFITWDESEGGELPIGMIVLSPLAKGGGYVSHTKYYHSSFVRTVEEVFGVPLLRDAKNQPSLADLFTSFP